MVDPLLPIFVIRVVVFLLPIGVVVAIRLILILHVDVVVPTLCLLIDAPYHFGRRIFLLTPRL